jgi:endonuclease YncB( thermonuclease family)
MPLIRIIRTKLNSPKRIEKKQRKLLGKINPDAIPILPSKGEIIPCVITEVYDGDTVTVIYPYQKTTLKIKLRLLGIDAPEIKGKDVTDVEHEAAIIVRDILRRWVNEVDPKKIFLKIKKFDKYGGRFLGDILIKISAKGEEPLYATLSDLLLEAGLVTSYAGDKKLKWTSKRLREIKKLADGKLPKF